MGRESRRNSKNRKRSGAGNSRLPKGEDHLASTKAQQKAPRLTPADLVAKEEKGIKQEIPDNIFASPIKHPYFLGGFAAFFIAAVSMVSSSPFFSGGLLFFSLIFLAVSIFDSNIFKGQSQLVKNVLKTVLSAVIMFSTVWIWYYYFDNRLESEIHGYLKPPSIIQKFLVPANDADLPNYCDPLLSPDAVVVHLGDGAAVLNKEKMTVIRIDGKEMLSLKRFSGGLLVSGQVYDSDGKIIIEIQDNEFRINQNNYFRAERPDTSTLRVYDQNNKEVLNVRFLNPKHIQITGIFKLPNEEPIVVEKDRILLARGNELIRPCGGNRGFLKVENGDPIIGFDDPPQAK